RQLHEAEIKFVSGGPNHGFDSRCFEIQSVNLLLFIAIPQLRNSFGRSVQAHANDVEIDHFERIELKPVHLRQHLPYIRCGHQSAALSAANVSQQHDSITGELMQVQALATILAGNLGVRRELGPGRFQVADLCVEHPHTSEPIVDVPTAIPPRHTSSAANGEI